MPQARKRLRVGLKPDGKLPAREGAEIRDAAGRRVGTVTSGGFGPTIGGPVAMGLVETESAVIGTTLDLIVREKAVKATVVPLPFVPKGFVKKP